ncbi:DUF4124 domain-containing protein [Haliea sp. E17]|uniref:DUF4124 domain-containing protein n=1 Tax=Haliea sp. E17 TaxID=3401576 RepID=UPI003AAE0E78
MRFPRVIFALVLVAANAGADSQQTTVYRSVDERGVVTFSDTPPEDTAQAETLTLRVNSPDVDPDAQQRLEAMRETTDRMAADRREREKHRAEIRELSQRSPAPAGYQPADQEQQDYWYSPYWGNYYPRPIRPPYHDRPPPLRPGVDPEAWSRSHNSQLMRPILLRPVR